MTLPDEVPVQPTEPCQHCGSGVLKVLTKERRLRCMQCFALDLSLTEEQVVSICRDFAWAPAQSGRKEVYP